MLLLEVQESACIMEDRSANTVLQEIASQKGISLWLQYALQHQPDHILRTIKFETITYLAVSIHFHLCLILSHLSSCSTVVSIQHDSLVPQQGYFYLDIYSVFRKVSALGLCRCLQLHHCSK